jgi:hypothetical protein
MRASVWAGWRLSGSRRPYKQNVRFLKLNFAASFRKFKRVSVLSKPLQAAFRFVLADHIFIQNAFISRAWRFVLTGTQSPLLIVIDDTFSLQCRCTRCKRKRRDRRSAYETSFGLAAKRTAKQLFWSAGCGPSNRLKWPGRKRQVRGACHYATGAYFSVFNYLVDQNRTS